MNRSICRWGLISTAAISRKNWKSIAVSGNGVITAVASRDRAKAEGFIGECMAEVPVSPCPAAVASYDELLKRDDVDAVYIALPTSLRKPWVLRAAEAGKHVLCEKPIASCSSDAVEMVTACRDAGVQFMDGVMFNHSARLDAIREELEPDGAVGPLRRITSHFCFSGDDAFQRDNIRVMSQLEPHGALGDLGWYNLRFTLWAMNYRMPVSVVAHTHKSLQGRGSPESVPAEVSGELFFESDVSAHFFCSFLVENQQFAFLSGRGGYIAVDDFVLPFYDAEVTWSRHNHVLEIDNCRWNMRRHASRRAVVEYASGEANSQEVRMIQCMNRIVLSGVLEPHWPEIALKTQRLMDACRRSADAGGERVEVL